MILSFTWIEHIQTCYIYRHLDIFLFAHMVTCISIDQIRYYTPVKDWKYYIITHGGCRVCRELYFVILSWNDLDLGMHVHHHNSQCSAPKSSGQFGMKLNNKQFVIQQFSRLPDIALCKVVTVTQETRISEPYLQYCL